MGFNLKIKPLVYYASINKINTYLNSTTFLLKNGKNLLLDGSDEVVLLDVLKDVISANIVDKRPGVSGNIIFYRITYDPILYNEILQHVIETEHNIVVVDNVMDIYHNKIVNVRSSVDSQNFMDTYYNDLNIRDEQLYSIMLDVIFTSKFLSNDNHHIYNIPKITRLVNDPYARFDYGETNDIYDVIYNEFEDSIEPITCTKIMFMFFTSS